jgi:DNA polymerase elongation subunit (family B)/intein/homing endonuclease
MSNDNSDIFVVEESTYIIRYGTPIILLFSRCYNNPTKTVTHEFSYEPYFYVPYGSANNVKSDLIKRFDDNIIIDALGREVQKVYTYIPSDVPKVKTLFEWRDESDVLFDKRFLIDHKIKYAYKIVDNIPVPVDVDTILSPRILYCDIETDNEEGSFPEPKDAAYSILMIQCRDSMTNKRVVFTINIPSIRPDVQFICKDERELIRSFCVYVKLLDPDILALWNGSGFDFPYIINRANKLGISLDGLSRSGYPRMSYENGRYSCRISGRSTLDMLEAFKKFTIGMAQRESYSLKSVISDHELLKDYAFEYEDAGPYIRSYIKSSRYEELIQYGINDVDALYNIDNALKLYTFYENLRMVSGAKLDDMLYNSRIIEMLLWHEGMKPMPEKNHDVDTGDKFKGAFVVTPTPGISEYVGTYDLASLYPNILIAFQKSPDIDGLVVKTLEKTLAMREELRAKCKADPDNIMLENQQLAIKFLNNSYYGVLGLPSFRLFNRSIAEFVTSTGRELNMFLQDRAKMKNKSVIFGDSVCKDTIVKIYDAHYNWNYIKISDLFSNVDFVHDDKEYCNLDCYVESIDDNGKLILDHVPYIMRHKCNKQMYNISITNSRSINVTEDHSVFCYVPKNINSKLRQKDRLVAIKTSDIGINSMNSVIVRRSTIHHNINSLNKDIKFYEYLGYHVGNGSIHYGKNGSRSGIRLGISFGKDDNELYNYFIPWLESNDYICNISKDNRNNGDYRFYGNLVYFIEEHVGHAKNKHIPDFMFYESVENIQAFIRGYFTADGTAIIRSNLPVIRLTSISINLIIGVQRLLYQVGIASGYFSENKTNTYNSKDSGTYSKHLVVHDILKFRDNVGFILERKQSRIRKCNPYKIMDTIDWSYSSVKIIPIEYNDYVYDLHCEQTNRYFANDVLVHNTDSIGTMPIKSVGDGQDLEAYFNDQLKKWSHDHNCKVDFKLKFEKLYRRLLFKSDKNGKGVKKKYCGHIIWEEGHEKDELNYKGLELKRSDQSNITRKCLHYFLETLLIKDDKSSAVQFVKEMYNNILSGNISIYDISIPKAVRKVNYQSDNPWVNGINYMKNEYNYIIQEGEKPRLLYLRGGNTICIDDGFDTNKIKELIDWSKMADVTIKKKMESYIWSIGMNWDAVVNGQQSLDKWF